MAQPRVLFRLIAAFIVSVFLTTYSSASNNYDESSQTSCPDSRTKPIESPCGCFMGPPGPAGTPGSAGSGGVPGAAGASGAVGPPGVPGVQGPQGLTGSMGPKGDLGLEGAVGLKGSKGESGDRGEAGQDGVNGINGDDGQDGANGARGLKGAKGAKGDGGLKGDSGEKGDEGDAGPAGRNGDPGTKGNKGSIGNQGTQGEPGTPYVPAPLSMFSATLTTTLQVSSGYQTVAFDSITLNLGNDYSPTSGFFTCRIPGIYFFAVGVLPSGTAYGAYIYVMRNEVQEAYAYAYTSDYSTLSRNVILDLEEGDEVYIRAKSPSKIVGSTSEIYSSFSGHLLYASTDMPAEEKKTEI